MSFAFPRRQLFALMAATAIVATPAIALADTALVAVAANFAEAADVLSGLFAQSTDHSVTLTTGSTGKLYAQIGEGAPFDILLSADAATPGRLVDEGNADGDTRFTYAVGQLTLWSTDPDRIGDDPRSALEDPDLRFVAMANPDLAPYGIAARETLETMGLFEALQPKIVMGQNIGQTHSMVATGAAELGFVALSAVMSPRAPAEGSRWDVPQEMFTPIRQDAVVLRHGAGNPAAIAFLEFLQTPAAIEVIESFGYSVE